MHLYRDVYLQSLRIYSPWINSLCFTPVFTYRLAGPQLNFGPTELHYKMTISPYRFILFSSIWKRFGSVGGPNGINFGFYETNPCFFDIPTSRKILGGQCEMPYVYVCDIRGDFFKQRLARHCVVWCKVGHNCKTLTNNFEDTKAGSSSWWSYLYLFSSLSLLQRNRSLFLSSSRAHISSPTP